MSRSAFVDFSDIQALVKKLGLDPRNLTSAWLYQLVGYYFNVWYSEGHCERLLRRLRERAT